MRVGAWNPSIVLCCCVLLTLASVCHTSAQDTSPLHKLIDARLTDLAGVQLPTCSDAEFLRRVSLDLIGMPPTADQVREFLGSAEPNKREIAVDRLLASPHYARHLASTFDLFLMERRPNTHVPADDWQAWLVRVFRENQPWNEVAKTILSTDGEDAAVRAPARFWLDRAVEPHLLTRDIGRVFFGRDLQCAQCHDHPLVEDYTQADYQGLLAFVSTSYPQVIKAQDVERTVIGERAGTELSFESVFLGVPHRTGPRLPSEVAIEEPFSFPGEEYSVPPTDNVKPIPSFSRRAQLAHLATGGTNKAFNQNIVNRLWSMLLGHGLVHPVDLHHADNPAYDSELLQLLTDSFVATNYDIKTFLREVTLTQVYQRTFDVPQDLIDKSAIAGSLIPTWDAELKLAKENSEQARQAYLTAIEAWQAAEAVALPVSTELDGKRQAYSDAQKQVAEAQQALATAEATSQAKRLLVTALEQSLAALQPAVTAAPDDQELAELSNKLKGRGEQGASELTTLAKAIEDATLALQTKSMALQVVKQEIEVIRARLQPLLATERQAELAMLEARRTVEMNKQRAGAIERRLTGARQWSQLFELKQQLVGLQQRRAELSANIDAINAQIEAENSALAELNGLLAKLMAEEQVSASTMETQRSQLLVPQREVEAIAQAVSALENAQRITTSDPALERAAAELATAAASAQQRLQAAQQVLQSYQTTQDTIAQSLAAAKQQSEGIQTALTNHLTTREQSDSLLTGVEQEIANCAKAMAAAENTLVLTWSDNFTLSVQKPLTPEQLCWSVFRVTGVYQQYWNAEVAELDKSAPLTDEQRADATVLAQRDVEIEQRVYDKLKGNLASFVSVYGAAAGQPQTDFFATADQALFAANGGAINAWVSPSADNVTQRMIAASDPRIAAEELYLAVLSRPPSESEVADVTKHLAARESDKQFAVQELVWAVLNSAEFRFNN